jgi:hypothetical protein
MAVVRAGFNGQWSMVKAWGSGTHLEHKPDSLANGSGQKRTRTSDGHMSWTYHPPTFTPRMGPLPNWNPDARVCRAFLIDDERAESG